MQQLAFYAPNVHTGGGLTLLNALIGAWPAGVPCVAFLDRRAERSISAPTSWDVVWCDRTIAGAIKAELECAARVTRSTVLFSFNSLTPVLAKPGRRIVYVHQPYLVGLGPPLRGRVALRVWLERLMFSLGRHGVEQFWVQTPTMRRRLLDAYRWKGQPPLIELTPFSGETAAAVIEDDARPQFDFIYVSDGAAHKNHERLLEAWALLASAGIRPSLALTLGERDASLWSRLSRDVERFGLDVTNLGYLPHGQVLGLYRRSGALIFASTAETFGLPMIEAAKAGLPILAAEADFVRDVCTPEQTFDPHSATSIARAVRRFINRPDDPPALLSASAVAEKVSALVHRTTPR